MLGAEAREANKAWLMQQVNHVLEPLMLAIVREKPSNAVSFLMSSSYAFDLMHLSSPLAIDIIHG